MPQIKNETYWVYILLCENNSYYTGYTNDLVKRYAAHVNGTGRCKYTRSYKPLTIAQCWQVSEKQQAMQIERAIKQLSKAEKTKLILAPHTLATPHPIRLVSKRLRQTLLKSAYFHQDTTA